MFTGIIQGTGEVAAIAPQADTIYTLETNLPLADMPVGASVACNGVCLTAIEILPRRFRVQVSAETLSKTTMGGWRIGTRVNLERPLRAGDELGGHLVSGHVDGIAQVVALAAEGESLRFTFSLPPGLQRFIAPKGSVTVDGVSLTVNEVTAEGFGVNIIPHTRRVTGFGALRVGDPVNIEVDMLARYLDGLLTRRGL